MSELFLKILNMSISASWLVLAVLLLRLALKKAPKWVSVLLWGIVAVRLICPFSVESVLSLIPSAETISPEIMMDPTPQIHTGVDALNNVINPVVLESFTPDPLTSMNPLQLWIPLAAIVWLAGVALMLLYTLVSYHLLRGKVRSAVRLQDNIYQSENVGSPFVLGILNPKIYLPFHLADKDMEYVLAHEKAHIHRKDHWWKPIGFLILAVHWFNPLLWLGYILLCRDIELACDEKVIKDIDGENRADYSQALLACSVSRRSIAACPLAFGEVGVKERIRSVMGYRKPAFWVIIAGIVVCAAVAVCFLTDPKPNSDDALPQFRSHTYIVEEVVYDCDVFSFTVIPGANAPVYGITEGMYLSSQKEYGNEGWTQLGKLEETVLTKETFDDLFMEPGTWAGELSADRLRRDTLNAWQLIYNGNICYYLLQMENGELYLAYGYTGPTHYGIRWLFKLEVSDSGYTGVVAKSGEAAIPMVSFSADTPVERYPESLHWLTVSQDNSSLVPFSVYKDGSEQFGFYNVYDAQTFAALEFFRPSGLAPQTYLFENADLNREYIVTLRFSAEPDALIYAFGARFDLTNEEIIETVFGRLKTYYKKANGTWQVDGRDYQYRLEINGRMHDAAMDSTFIYLSNLETITFEQAWKAAGLSSSTQDYFAVEDAVLVDWLHTGETTSSSTAGYQKLTLEDVIILSQKGEDLSLSDFEKYHYEGGSGRFIRVYEIDGHFELWIANFDGDEEDLDFYLTLADDPQQRIDIREGGVVLFISEHTQTAAISNAVTAAILERNGGDRFPGEPEGQIPVECHLIRGIASRSGTPVVGQTNHIKEAIVYVQYVYNRYVYKYGELERVAGISTPAILTFSGGADGVYILKDFWEPREGSVYAEDIRSKFPQDIAGHILDPDNDAVDMDLLESRCLEKAKETLLNQKLTKAIAIIPAR